MIFSGISILDHPGAALQWPEQALTAFAALPLHDNGARQ